MAGGLWLVHLAHSLGVKAFTCRRVRNDELDAADLADLLRMGRLPEAWALIEAIQRIPGDSVIGAVKDGIIARHGKEAKNIAKVAAARRLLTLACYGMRDGQIRCLSTTAGEPPATPAKRAA